MKKTNKIMITRRDSLGDVHLNTFAAAAAAAAAQMDLKNAVTEHHVDFTRGYFGVAFLTQSQQEEIDSNSAGDTEESWDGILSYIVRAWNSSLVSAYTSTRKFVHAEVCFWCSEAGMRTFGGSDYMVACGTRSTGTSLVKRRFHQGYEWKWIQASPAEQGVVFNFYRSQLGKPYDRAGSMRTFTDPRRRKHTTGWYCSEIVLAALQLLPDPAFHEHRANCVETDDVYDIVCSSARCSVTQSIVAPRQLATMWGTNTARSSNLSAWKNSMKSKN